MAFGFRPLPLAGGATNFMLTAATGAVAVTGVAALFSTSLLSVSASYAVTTVAAAFNLGLTSPVGVFTETGVAAAFSTKFLSSAGSYSVTGNAASLKPALTSSVGAFSETGIAALFKISLLSASGPYAVAGVNAILTQGYVLTGAPTSYRVTLNDANLYIWNAVSNYNVGLPVNCVLAQLYPMRELERTVEFVRGKASKKTAMSATPSTRIGNAVPSFTSVTKKGFNG